MKHLSWILTVPLLVVAATFLASNTQDVPIDFWPFSPVVELPFHWLLLGTLFAGFLIGGLAMWLTGARGRRRAREARYRANHLEREVIRLKREVERAGARAQSAAPKAPALPAAASGR